MGGNKGVKVEATIKFQRGRENLQGVESWVIDEYRTKEEK